MGGIMDNDRYYQLGSHDKLFNKIDELTDAIAERDIEIVSLRKQNKQLKEALIKWRQREWPGTDQRSVVESEFRCVAD
jgi:hypothetical protein